MNWITAHSQLEDFESAWTEVRSEVLNGLSAEADLLFVFASSHYEKEWSRVAQYVAAAFPHAVLFGAGARGTMESRYEFEDGPSLSVMAAVLSGGGFVEAIYLPEDQAAANARLKEIAWSDVNGIMLLVDPFSVDAEELVEHLDQLAPNAPKVGGLLSGGTRLGDHALWDRDGVYDEGALMLILGGALSIEPIVAQSATPIGDPLIVMKKRGYLIDEFNAGKPADVLATALEDFGPTNLDHLWERIVVGLDVGRQELSFAPAKYLIRSVIGLDPDNGSLAVASHLENYQTLRFHIRDPRAAQEALEAQLVAAKRSTLERGARATVVFNCIVRGAGFFGNLHSDAVQIAAHSPGNRSVGLFCSAEIGPVGERTYVHSFTASIALICERTLN